MNTLYVVHAFNTLDGAPSLQHMRRCASLEAAEATARDFSARYQGVLAYSRQQSADLALAAPARTIHFRTGAVPAEEPGDVISIFTQRFAAPAEGLH